MVTFDRSTNRHGHYFPATSALTTIRLPRLLCFIAGILIGGMCFQQFLMVINLNNNYSGDKLNDNEKASQNVLNDAIERYKAIDFSDVVYLDKDAMENVKHTFEGGHSWLEWHPDSFGDVKLKDRLDQFQTSPLLATVDRRPLTAKAQMHWDKHGLHNDGELLGCAVTATTFLSKLEMIHHQTMMNYEPICNVCVQFSNRFDMKNFIPGVGYEPLKLDQHRSATKCFQGKARLTARFVEWQKYDDRFYDFGYPYTIDCTLRNGIKELTCQEITTLSNSIGANDSLQKVYLETKFTLDGYFSDDYAKLFDIYTRWPWSALQSHDDDRSHIAQSFPKSWDDTSSKFVPSSAEELRIAHVVGPLYDMSELDGSIALKSMIVDTESKGGVHFRFLTTLFHQIRHSPDSTLMMAVVDGQIHRTYEYLTEVLNTKISVLYPKYGNMLISNYKKLANKEYIPIEDIETIDDSYDMDLTLYEVLGLRGIRLHVLPLTTTSVAFEKNVCGVQYAFAPYLAARFAADYQIMTYSDGDTAFIEHDYRTLQHIFYDRFFSIESKKCVGHRFKLIEQYVKPEYTSVDNVLKCVEDLASNEEKWKYAVKNCDLKEGHIVTRTDSIQAFSVHHPDTFKTYLPPGLNDCVVHRDTGDGYFITADSVAQIHLRDRVRKVECACFINEDKSS